jgi:hypothetical protein
MAQAETAELPYNPVSFILYGHDYLSDFYPYYVTTFTVQGMPSGGGVRVSIILLQ